MITLFIIMFAKTVGYNKSFKRKKFSWLFHYVHIIANYIFPLKLPLQVNKVLSDLIYSYKLKFRIMIPALIICWVGVSFLIDEIGKSEGFELVMIWAIVIIIIVSMIFHTVHLCILNKNTIQYKLGVMYFPKEFWSKNSIAIPLVEITNVVENNF